MVSGRSGSGFPSEPTVSILRTPHSSDATWEVTVPLSEHEQRLLEQMERALYAEDPKFATSMRNSRASAGDKRKIALGVLGFLAGMAMLVAGVATQVVLIGVGGFLAMLGGIWLTVAAWRSSQAQPGAGAQPAAGQPKPPGSRPGRPRAVRPRRRSGFSERREERWRRRRARGDF